MGWNAIQFEVGARTGTPSNPAQKGAPTHSGTSWWSEGWQTCVQIGGRLTMALCQQLRNRSPSGILRQLGSHGASVNASPRCQTRVDITAGAVMVEWAPRSGGARGAVGVVVPRISAAAAPVAILDLVRTAGRCHQLGIVRHIRCCPAAIELDCIKPKLVQSLHILCRWG